MACHGTGSIELPVDEIVDALRPHLITGIDLLKKRLIALAQQRGLRSH